jgi:micrococcal nuclease
VGTPIQLQVTATDRYQRQVALLTTNGKSINLSLVQGGHAVVYRQYLSSCPTLRDPLLAAEAKAKQQRLGFWAQDNPIMP